MNKGCIVWLTGLPCSGKTSISDALAEQLTNDYIDCVQLDGDTFRSQFCKDLGFSKEDREENLRRVIAIAKKYEEQGIIAICSFVSPLISMRENIRNQCKIFVEVFVNCDLEICIERDVKGMYAKAFKGEIKEFTGLTSPYENPKSAEVTCDTNNEVLCCSVNKVYDYLKEQRLI